MFKNKEDYLDQRKALMDAAEKALADGDATKANELMDSVRELDKAFEDWAKTNADFAALNKTPVIAPSVPMQDGKLDTTGGHPIENMTADSDEYKTAWLKAVKGETLTDSEKKVIDTINSKGKLNVETASEHTLVIPTTVRNGIWEAAAEEHPALADLLTTTIQGDIVIIKDTSAKSDADWVDEADSSADAEFTEGQLRLTGCELAKSVTISWKLKKMNDQDYEAYLIRKLGEKVGNAIAKALFYGKGKPAAEESFKPQARGVVTALKAQENTPQVITYRGNVAYKDTTSLMALIKSAYAAGAVIYAENTTIWNQLANIVDTNKRPIFVPDVTNGGVGKIFGIPVKAEDGVNAGDIVLANFKKCYAFNFNEQMAIYKEDHVKARTTDYMAYGIADGDVLTENGFAMLTPSAS